MPTQMQLNSPVATDTMNRSKQTGNATEFFNSIFNARAKREMRMVLAGKTGEGKSSLGNSILGSRTFHTDCSASSVTVNCACGERELHGRCLSVVDLPGLFDTRVDQKTIATEIGKAVGLSAPGPHAFLIVVKAGNRFTEEAQQTINLLQQIFGGDVLRYCIIVITGEDNIKAEGGTIDTWIANAPSTLRQLIESCKNRYLAINNRAERAELDSKVSQLMILIDQMIEDNGGRVYTNEMYEAAERKYREQEEAQLKAAQEAHDKIERQIAKLEYAADQARRDQERARQQLDESRSQSQEEKDALLAKVRQATERVEQAHRDNAALAAEKQKILRDAEEQSTKTRGEGRREVASNSGSTWNKIKPIAAAVASSIPVILSAVLGIARSGAGPSSMGALGGHHHHVHAFRP